MCCPGMLHPCARVQMPFWHSHLCHPTAWPAGALINSPIQVCHLWFARGCWGGPWPNLWSSGDPPIPDPSLQSSGSRSLCTCASRHELSSLLSSCYTGRTAEGRRSRTGKLPMPSTSSYHVQLVIDQAIAPGPLLLLYEMKKLMV